MDRAYRSEFCLYWDHAVIEAIAELSVGSAEPKRARGQRAS